MIPDVGLLQPPGTFVEIGAVDGVFMSQTLMLEKTLGWSGLLVEPDPRSFAILQDRRRNASLAPLCVNEQPSDLVSGLADSVQLPLRCLFTPITALT